MLLHCARLTLEVLLIRPKSLTVHGAYFPVHQKKSSGNGKKLRWRLDLKPEAKDNSCSASRAEGLKLGMIHEVPRCVRIV